MLEKLRPLHHHTAADASDEDLQREARAHLAKHAHTQLIAELVAKLRLLSPSWWSPEFLRHRWSALDRMRWLAQRADVRQRITTALTGLPANTARAKTPEFQADLIDSVLDSHDVNVDRFEEAFEPVDIAVYAPVAEIWTEFRERMPWGEDSPFSHRLVGWLLRTLLADRCAIDGAARKPILTPWEVRSAIDPRLWQTRVPVEVRAMVDEARLRQEKARPRDPFTARHELLICTPEQIAASIPIGELAGVLALAERSMGFDDEAPAASGELVAEDSRDEAASSRPSQTRISRVA
jgi:hypothetical protein